MGSLLDDVLPAFDVHEIHEITVPAAPAETYEALQAVTAREIGLLGPLMALRTLPRRVKHLPVLGDPSAPVLEQFLAIGFIKLAEHPGSELVVGAIGRFWSPSGNAPVRVITTSEDFAAFSEPGFAKAAMNFHVRPDGSGSRIVTETRVVGTDAAATRRFRLYWLLIRPGSGALRRSWLKAIRRRLEATGAESGGEGGRPTPSSGPS